MRIVAFALDRFALGEIGDNVVAANGGRAEHAALEPDIPGCCRTHKTGCCKQGEGDTENRKQASGRLGQGDGSHRISPAVMNVQLIWEVPLPSPITFASTGVIRSNFAQ